MIYCGLPALSKAERHAMAIKSILEALRCEEALRGSEEKMKKEKKTGAIGKNGNIIMKECMK